MKGYTKLPRQKGLYRNTTTGRFYAQKKIKGKKFSQSFDSLAEAKYWIREFHPDKARYNLEVKNYNEINGSKDFTFSEVWERYKEAVYPNIRITTRLSRERRMEKFVVELLPYKMKYINPEIIDQVILKNKELCDNSRRYHFNYEIDLLLCVFSWYRKNLDFYFRQPIVSTRHKPMGVIKKRVGKSKKMRIEDVAKFLLAMKEINELNGLFYEFATIQFLTASRAEDVGGLCECQVDLNFNEITWDRALKWPRKKGMKPWIDDPKVDTEEPKISSLTPSLRNLLLKRMNLSRDKDGALFHKDGELLTYASVRHSYARGLERAGLEKQYSGTHFLRKAMARATNERFKSLQTVMAVTGHSTEKMAVHYSGRDTSIQKEVIHKVEADLKLVDDL